MLFIKDILQITFNFKSINHEKNYHSTWNEIGQGHCQIYQQNIDDIDDHNLKSLH